jgi:hypothetical protein
VGVKTGPRAGDLRVAVAAIGDADLEIEVAIDVPVAIGEWKARRRSIWIS